MSNQKMMAASITGPALKSEIDWIMDLEPTEREKHMDEMSTSYMNLFSHLLRRLEEKTLDPDQMIRAILWKNEVDEYSVEIIHRH